jgi:hypothetical protein
MTKEQRTKLFQDQLEIFLDSKKEHIEDAFKLLLAEIDLDNFHHKKAIETIKLFIKNARAYKKAIKAGQNPEMLYKDLEYHKNIIVGLIKDHYQYS